MKSNSLPQRSHLHRVPVLLPDDQRLVYFITTCCHDRQPIFLKAEYARAAFSALMVLAERYQWKIWFVCFMPDHVHVLLSPALSREQKLSSFVQGWKSSCAQRIRAAGCEARIWQREYFDRILRSDEKIRNAWEYVRLNPFNEGLGAEPDHYLFAGTPEEVSEKFDGNVGK